MKLQQLRCLTEVARRDLNVSEAAEALHTSQPGVSKQIRALEDELGVQIFVRHGKRLVSVTEPGKAVIAIAERILAEAQNLRRAGEEFANEQLGTLTIAATHTQARYALPKAVAAFKRRYPKVRAGHPPGQPDADLRAGASPARPTWRRHRDDRGVPGAGLAALLPVEPLRRGAAQAPAAQGEPLTLEAIAEHPIVTYDFAFANRSLVQKAFEQRGLKPHVVLTAPTPT